MVTIEPKLGSTESGGAHAPDVGGGAREASVAFGFYLLLSFLFFGDRVIAHLGSRTIGVGQDPPILMWALKWWPHSISQGWNPLHTDLVNAPQGFDTTFMTSIPGPSLALAPLTQTAGPVVAYNVLVFLAPALSAWAAFLFCRSLGASRWASLAGGYLFGFSSYVIAQTAGHANLALVACIPLAWYLVVRRFTGTLSPRPFVAALTAVLVFQFLTSTEIFLTLTLFGGLVLVIAALAVPEQREALKSIVKLVAIAYVLTGLVVSPYLLPTLSASGDLQTNTGIAADPLNLVIPTKLTALGGNALESVSSRFVFADPTPWEQGSYLGLPLILIALLFWRERRDRVATAMLAATVLILIATLGPRLNVLGTDRTPLRLPWDLFTHLPLFEHIIPIRLIVYAWLLVAVMAALWLSRGGAARCALGAMAIAFLLPNPWATVSGSDFQSAAGEPSPWSWPRSVPEFFSNPQERNLIDGHGPIVVLPYHYQGDSVLWQAEANMSFQMAGGFLSTTVPREFSCWGVYQSLTRNDFRSDEGDDFIAFLRAKGVGAVLSPESFVDTARPLLRDLPGERIDSGGMRVYLLPSDFRDNLASGLPPPSWRRADPFWCPTQ